MLRAFLISLPLDLLASYVKFQQLDCGTRIINVQWDFSYGKRFSSTPRYSFIRSQKNESVLQTQYEFPQTGTFRIACKVQDDMGGEGIWSGEIKVT